MTREQKIKALKRIQAGESVTDCLIDINKLHKEFLATVDFDILQKACHTGDLTEIQVLFDEYVKNFKND